MNEDKQLRADRPASALVPILIAVIGLLGSLGGAWIATGAKFERELEEKGREIEKLRADVEKANTQLEVKRQEMEVRLANAERELDRRQQVVDKKVTETEKQQKSLAHQITEAEKILTYARKLYEVKTLSDLRALMTQPKDEKH